MTAQLGTGSRQFLSLPDGVTLPGTSAQWFAPGPSFASLSVNGTRAAYEQKCDSGLGFHRAVVLTGRLTLPDHPGGLVVRYGGRGTATTWDYIEAAAIGPSAQPRHAFRQAFWGERRLADSGQQMMNAQPSDAKAHAGFPKQAIVVIHGMGEQIPMDTIKGFVRAAWETDAVVTDNGMPNQAEVWSKPDSDTGSLELRRITTRQSASTETFPNGVRSDFYELYWADLSAGSTLDQVENWICGLLLRNPVTNVPRGVRSAWTLLWILSLVIVYFLVAPAVKADFAIFGWHPYRWEDGVSPLIGPAIAGAIGWLANHYLLPYFGRVVRYTRATPENIAARKDIRERGLALLRALHDDKNNKYERIVIVGHSLGSILGYDLISYLWAELLASHTFERGSAGFFALQAVESALEKYYAQPTEANVAAFRAAQRALGRLLRLRPVPERKADGSIDLETDGRWLITDFVTLGSPLTHSDFLLAADSKALQAGIDTREFPAAPPVRETLDPKNIALAQQAGFPLRSTDPELLSFPFFKNEKDRDGKDTGRKIEYWQMHHAAPFAATRWTNIHDPARFIFCGDLISGPLRPLFRQAIVDVDLRALRGQSWSFSHTKYWTLAREGDPVPQPVLELRKALNLAGQFEAL